MTFQVSPGVNTSEIDLTTVIPAVSTSSGAVAGPFDWGPVDTVRQVSNENELVSTFGKPSTNTANTFFTGANFLAYASDLRVIRSANTGSNNALANVDSASLDAGKYCPNEETFEAQAALNTIANHVVMARYPGALGNSLKVSLLANTSFGSWAYQSLFDKPPGTSYFVSSSFGNATANDELHLVVVDEDGAITGVANTVLEKYSNLSKATNVKDESGESLYWKDVVNRKSKYVYIVGVPEDTGGTVIDNGNLSLPASWGVPAMANSAFTTTVNTNVNGGNVFSLAGGVTVTPTAADIIRSYDQIEQAEKVDVQLVMLGGANAAICIDVIGTVESRKDCVAFISPPLANTQAADPTTSVVDWRNNALANLSSSYAVMDSGWKYQYDKYNDVYRWVPLNGDIAGLCARTDTDRDPWFSPAGLTRGQIKNIVKLSYNPTKAQRDTLYKAAINPVVSFTGEGTMLFGDKTLLGRPSAFDRINVRRLFIVLEKSIAKAARSSLFEFNDEFTRAQFVNLVEPFLRTVQGRRGIYDYRVVCDETNNTAEIIDRNEFVGDIYVKPAKSINFIQLNFVAVRTGVAFEEIVGKF
jgi:Phage tail sheath protein subtilisin-like domain/Phage tail sheath C-terminal domain